MSESVRLKTEWLIYRFIDPSGEIARELERGARVEEVASKRPGSLVGVDSVKGNVALNEGLQAIIDMICGLATVTPWNSANARIGVGDSSTPEDPSQTGLLGTNKYWKGMDSGYPTRDGQTAIWRATFGPDEANFAWREFTVVNAPNDTGINLNRKVADKGTKAQGETWTLELRITFS